MRCPSRRRRAPRLRAFGLACLAALIAETARAQILNLGDIILGFRDTTSSTNTTIDLGSYSEFQPGGMFYNPGVAESLGISLTKDGLATTYGANFLTDPNLHFAFVGTTGDTTSTRDLFVSALATGPGEVPGVPNSTPWTVASIIAQSTQASKFETLESNNVGGFNGVSTSSTSVSISWSAIEATTAGQSFGAYATGKLETPSPAGSASDFYALNPQASGPGVGKPGAFLGTFTIDASGNLDFTAASGGSTPPAIVEPVSQSGAVGGTASFTFSVGETPAPTYQWSFNGAPLQDGAFGSTTVAGSTSPTLELSNLSAADAGTYTCVATNASGSTTSTAATLTIGAAADEGRLINISCRAQVGTGAGILIAGYAIGGSGAAGKEPVLVRASGPALAASPFNLPGTLPDPLLQLTQTGANNVAVASNQGWEGLATISSTAAEVGAFPWTNTAGLDAALVESLAPGTYTAGVSGASGDTGVSLVEVYDATPAGGFTSTSPRLTNISARVNVGSGANILIAGFVIGGNTPITLLIRASGPALAASPFNVAGTLPDPELQLYSGSTLVGSNSGWGGSQAIASAASSVGAFAWSNPSSNDSALLVTLQPGAYTAQVAGASGDTGVALVEVYEVP